MGAAKQLVNIIATIVAFVAGLLLVVMCFSLAFGGGTDEPLWRIVLFAFVQICLITGALFVSKWATRPPKNPPVKPLM